MRGGVSLLLLALLLRGLSSPHAWGCFLLDAKVNLEKVVFPTCVGVFLLLSRQRRRRRRLPHMRGGVSVRYLVASEYGESSPHAWGCFLTKSRFRNEKIVFPTCVGVFPSRTALETLLSSLPHMRGGVSDVKQSSPNRTRSSPHAWGCFH